MKYSCAAQLLCPTVHKCYRIYTMEVVELANLNYKHCEENLLHKILGKTTKCKWLKLFKTNPILCVETTRVPVQSSCGFPYACGTVLNQARVPGTCPGIAARTRRKQDLSNQGLVTIPQNKVFTQLELQLLKPDTLEQVRSKSLV